MQQYTIASLEHIITVYYMSRFSIYRTKIFAMTFLGTSPSADESLNLEKSIKYYSGISGSTCQIRKMITGCNVLLYVEYLRQVRRRYSGSFSTRIKYISYIVPQWHDKYLRIFQCLNDRQGVLYHEDKLRWDHLGGKGTSPLCMWQLLPCVHPWSPLWNYWSHPEIWRQ